MTDKLEGWLSQDTLQFWTSDLDIDIILIFSRDLQKNNYGGFKTFNIILYFCFWEKFISFFKTYNLINSNSNDL